MATPRKKWVKVEDSIGRDDLSNDELATLIRLMTYLNTQWARDGLNGEAAARILLRPVDLMACTGSESLARARRIIDACSVKVELTVTRYSKNTEVFWPKYLVAQGLDTPEQGKPGETLGNKSPPPQDARRKTQTQDARRNKNKAQAPAADAAPPPEKPSVKGLKPERFEGPERDRIQNWAQAKGYPKDVLDAGMERFREWAPLKQQSRTKAQWVSAFMRIVREGVESHTIVAKGDEKPKGLAYGDAAPMLAERRRIHDEENARGRLRIADTEEPESIGKIIDESLKIGKGR